MPYEPSPDFEIPELYYTALFNALPGNCYLLQNDAPRYTILAATVQILELSGLQKEQVIGKGLFEVFPSNPSDAADTGEKALRASLAQVLQQKEANKLPVNRYDVADGSGQFVERYWSVENKPVFTPGGDEVAYIIHTAEDITDQVKAKSMQERMKGMELVNNLFMQVPLPICILKGKDLIVELANEPTLQLWGRTKEIIGLPLEVAIPEVKGQGYSETIREVLDTGETRQVYESPVTLLRNGKQTAAYINYVYQPYYEADSTKVAGVLAIGSDVTDKVLARKQVEESNEKYHTLFNSMDQGFCVLEMIFDNENHPVDYRFLETNPVFEQQTGLMEAIGKTALQLVPNLEQHWFDLYGKVALTGEPIRFTEGSESMERWFDVFAFRIGDNSSRKVALLFTNITERKKTEEAIQQSESNLRNMILQAPVAMAILEGPSFVVKLANDRMYELWGKSPKDLLDKSIFEGLPEVRNQGYEERLNSVYTTGERFSALGIPVTLPRNGGIETVYIDLLYEAFRNGDGAISGIMAVATDITEQVMARKKVEESNKEFQFVTDFMPQMIWITRPDGYHYYYNKQWYDYTGLTYGETEGDGWNDVFHPDDQERAWQMWRHSLATGDPYEIEYRCRRYDGAYRWVLGRALPLRDESGTIIKWFGTCTDIHDQKKASEILEEKVEERTRELKQLNEQLKQFTYAASHDLQEPLRKISFFLDRLLANIGPTLEEENKRTADRIQHTAGRMRVLIEDLLAYSNTSLGVTGFAEVDLNNVVKGVLDDMEATIIEKGAEIDLQELPAIKGDQRQLRQLFQNLVSNALKYHKKEVPPRVEISARLVKGEDTEAYIQLEQRGTLFYEIVVKDNGIGFDSDDAQRIFRLFQRLHGKAEYEGTGVGLAIVQKVVENHQGYVWAESEAGEGATFRVLLPADRSLPA